MTGVCSAIVEMLVTTSNAAGESNPVVASSCRTHPHWESEEAMINLRRIGYPNQAEWKPIQRQYRSSFVKLYKTKETDDHEREIITR
jgi:hypothetical protein